MRRVNKLRTEERSYKTGTSLLGWIKVYEGHNPLIMMEGVRRVR